MPDGVIGIDVDDYGLKTGGRTLALLESQHGALPPTYTSTSRTDLINGIRFYRVLASAGLRAVLSADLPHGGTTADIDIIQPGHRYAVVWPSTHPEGRLYRWLGPDGSQFDGVPSVSALPRLPEGWVHVLAKPPRKRGDVAPIRTTATTY
jgi:hypothetical protein